MQRSFNELALPGLAPAAHASTSPHFFASKEISRADLPLVQRQKTASEFVRLKELPLEEFSRSLTAILRSLCK